MDIHISELSTRLDVRTYKRITDGWSNDIKYYVETSGGEELLLRVSDLRYKELKNKEFEELQKLQTLNIPVQRAVDIWSSDSTNSVYILFTWIEGENAEEILSNLDTKEQYTLGLEAGRILKKIHSIEYSAGDGSWAKRFNAKIDKKIKVYQDCKYGFEGAKTIIGYINNNRYLLDDRPQTLQHGDYHINNMVIDSDHRLSVIDFNRMDHGDPWEEFNRITWCASISSHFASGRINGYFDGNVPDDFFKLLALYIGSNQLSSIPWGAEFGRDQLNVMINEANKVVNSYNGYRTYIPDWYISK